MFGIFGTGTGQGLGLGPWAFLMTCWYLYCCWYWVLLCGIWYLVIEKCVRYCYVILGVGIWYLVLVFGFGAWFLVLVFGFGVCLWYWYSVLVLV